jgi:HTH-type transcriptional regulator/antitoxin HigA
MTSTTPPLWSPDWLVAPGEFLVEALAERGMTQAELARRIARPVKTVSEIATGKAAITPVTAIQLERALGISASFWNAAETRYREAQARQRARSELRDYIGWFEQFPIKDLQRHGELPAFDAVEDGVGALLSYFGVSSPTGWDAEWGQVGVAYRFSGGSPTSTHSLAAWLRSGERQAAALDVAGYNERRFRSTLAGVRRLSHVQIFDVAVQHLTAELAAAGVAFVVVPSLSGAPASGAARWLRGVRPLIQLSLRYLSDDQFWYSLYHEGGHLLTGGRRAEVVEDVEAADLNDDRERQADLFARDSLVPPDAIASFAANGDFTREAVRRMATNLDISPGIFVGRLQHERLIAPSELNDLKRRYQTG